MRRTHALLCALALVITAPAMGQQVYRCEANGKVGYSHEPCPGAKAIDATPTQGMDKMTGKSLKSADVQRDEFRKQMSDMSSQITGISPETHARLAQRYKLARTVQLECASWDARLPGIEEDASQARPQQKEQAEAHLYQARKRFRELRC